jgi:alkanesulfonate monooxygenase SsuD/methylene tetrahydromethanopterin reductase-like flavin-dependent oxidoreductase (luciferase family)
VHLGIHLVRPPSSNPPAVLQATAHAAEAIGYRSLWVGDPVLDGAGPAGAERSLDALASLAFLAAITQRIRLGTNVLAGAWYPPELLARSLATVDQLSRGRLTVGMSSAASDGPGGAVDGLLGALEAAWGGATPDERAPAAGLLGPRPVQVPRPPILLTGRSEAELDRAGRIGDGWHAAPEAPEDLARRWHRVRRAAAEAGRDPDQLALVVRVRLDGGTGPATIARQVAALAGIGASEVILEVDDDRSLDAALARYAEVAEAVEAVEPQPIG